MRKIALVTMLVLAGCGGSKAPDPTPTTEPARHKGIACAGFPDFVALPPNAVVKTCQNGDATASQVIGKIVFESDMSLKDIVGFYKDKAGKSGLPDGISSSNPDNAVYSANDTTTKRSFQMSADRQAAGGIMVTVDWNRENWDAVPKPVDRGNSGG